VKIEITCAPEELKKVLQIMRTNDTQVHIDTVAQTAKSMATEGMSLDDNPYTR